MYKRTMRPGYWRTRNNILPNDVLLTTTVEWVEPAKTGPMVWVEENYFEHLNGVSEMKRREAAKQKGKGKFTSQGDAFLKDFPNVETYMGDCWYEDGKPRELSRLTITLTGSGVSISLTDPDERCTAFTDGKTIREALEALEGAFVAGKDPWRPWPKSFGRKGS